jgi:hypothetical protein
MTGNSRENRYQATTRRDIARAVTEALARRHPALGRALAKAPKQRRYVIAHAVRYWMFTGTPEFRLPAA